MNSRWCCRSGSVGSYSRTPMTDLTVSEDSSRSMISGDSDRKSAWAPHDVLSASAGQRARGRARNRAADRRRRSAP